MCIMHHGMTKGETTDERNSGGWNDERDVAYK